MLTLSYVAEVPTQLGEVIRLVGDEGFHAATVLRLQEGEEGPGGWRVVAAHVSLIAAPA